MRKKFKPRGYWTKERCLKEGRKYITRMEFRKQAGGAYEACYRKGWLNEVCKHMQPVFKWSKVSAIKEARKYKTRMKFQKQAKGAYNFCRENGWLDEACKLMQPVFKWSKVSAIKEARKYYTKTDFAKKSGGCYDACRKNGWFDEACKHMKPLKKPNGYWTKERCFKEALKYKTRWEFQKQNGSAYRACLKNGWFDEACKHMENKGHLFKRALYAFEFPNNSVYVGLTFDYEDRYKRHMKDNQLIRNLTFKYGHEFIMLNVYYDIDIIGKKEIDLIHKYRSKGWKILNKAKGGALGSSPSSGIWSQKNCFEVARKYKSRGEFQKYAWGAYNFCRKNGWLEEACKHMEPVFKWSKVSAIKEARKYYTKTDFAKKSGGCYYACRKNGWLEEACNHMARKKPGSK